MRTLHRMLSWPKDAFCDHWEDQPDECNDKVELWAIFEELEDPASSELVGYVCGTHKAKYEETMNA